MIIQVDARGLACPQPVINTKKALDGMSDGVVLTIVDNAVARDNVVKYARSAACTVSVEEKAGEFHMKIVKGNGLNPEERAIDTDETVLLFTSEGLGRGDDGLGKLLSKNFFYALTESNPLPKKILFLNGGVRLAVEGSEALEHLRKLASLGVEILSCGICLDYLGLKEKLAVGQITNMYSTVEALCQAKKVISF